MAKTKQKEQTAQVEQETFRRVGRPRNKNGMLGKKIVSIDISAEFMQLFDAVLDEVCERSSVTISGAVRDILLNALVNGDIEKLFGSLIRKEGKDKNLSLRTLAERRLEKWKVEQAKIQKTV